MRERMDVSILLARRYHREVFWVDHHHDIPKVKKILVRYKSVHVDHDEVKDYLESCGYNLERIDFETPDEHGHDSQLIGNLISFI